MAKYVVKGVERKVGDFNNDKGQKVPYDNVLLHCLVVNNSPIAKINMLGGNKTDIIKLKNDFQNLVYVDKFPVMNFVDLIGCEIELFQDSDGKIECVAVTSIEATI